MRSGEDVIATIDDEYSDHYSISNPLKIRVEFNPKTGHQVLIINPWTVISLIEESVLDIYKRDILFEMTPKVQFEEYYSSVVKLLFFDDEIQESNEFINQYLEKIKSQLKNI